MNIPFFLNLIQSTQFYFCLLHRELDADMLAIKELNAEIFRVMKDKENADAKPNMLQLSFKTNRLLKKILLRRFQLEQEAQYIRKMISKVAGGDESEDINADIETPKDGIDLVINKLKTMVQDLDTGDNGRGVSYDGNFFIFPIRPVFNSLSKVLRLFFCLCGFASLRSLIG